MVQRSTAQAVPEPLIARRAPSRVSKQLDRKLNESVRRPLLAVAIVAALGVAVVTAIVVMHPYIPEDAVIERDVQATNWGLLALTFPVFSWIGDAKGAVVEVIVFVAILVFNRPAWRLAIAAGMTGVWYVILSHLIIRPRPTTAQVLQVTEHPGASSFPSGHTIFVATLMRSAGSRGGRTGPRTCSPLCSSPPPGWHSWCRSDGFQRACSDPILARTRHQARLSLNVAAMAGG